MLDIYAIYSIYQKLDFEKIVLLLNNSITLHNYLIQLILFMRVEKLNPQQTQNKVIFRTFYKDRSNKSLLNQANNKSINVKHHQSAQKLQSKLNYIQQQQPNLENEGPEKQLKSTLHQINFKAHDNSECLCGSCQCGRHLCKFNLIKPDLAKQTSYTRHFPIKIVSQPQILIPQETKHIKSDYLDLKSTYSNQFIKDKRLENIIRPKPLNHLNVSGSLQSLTTYAYNFKDFKGTNQYIKPTDNVTRNYYPMKSSTTYKKQFTSKNIVRRHSLKNLDSLHSSKLWLGESTYNKTFQRPTHRQLKPLSKKIDKAQQILDYSFRFKTSYKNDFISKASAICPSKLEISNNLKQKSTEMKHILRENGDYKGISPHFQPISTSKHFYV